MTGYLTVTDDDTLTDRGISVLSKAFVPRAESPTATPPITIVGDSHAEYWGQNAAAAATVWGRPVTADAISGQQSVDIAARLGAEPARVTVTGNALPASGAVAVTSITDAAGTGIRPLRTGASGTVSRPVVVAGAACTLSTSDLGVTYTLTRTTPGPVVPVPPATPMTAGLGVRGSVPIILAPRNDIGKDDASTLWRVPLATILDRYRRIVNWLAPDGRFLLLSVLPWSDESPSGAAARQQLNDALRDQHPQQWIDWAAWLRTDAAFTAAGVTKTAQDTTDISKGITPTSFRRPADTGHLNASGYAAASALIALPLAAGMAS